MKSVVKACIDYSKKIVFLHALLWQTLGKEVPMYLHANGSMHTMKI